MTVDFPRETALKILYEINEKGAYSNLALNKQLEAGGLGETDRGFVTELVYGTVKWRLTIDWIICQFSSIKLKKISPWILNILRAGTYQLLYMDRIPESAACNESAKLAKKYGHQASTGFVNAVLRNIARNRDNLKKPDKTGEPVKYLSIAYSHPEWMVERFLLLFGPEFTESLLESNNNAPEFTIRVNTLKTSREKLAEALAQEGMEVAHGRFSRDALIIKKPSSISRLAAFQDGLFQVQDESSMLVARILDPKPGEFVLDACSAPGGKATHIAQLMENRGTVLARDIHEHKIKLIEQSVARLGIEIIKTEIHDTSMPDAATENKADRVLLDAPCTGLGIIRRKPDIKWRKESSDTAEITGLQRKMIAAAARSVKPGGVLVYSTCTILPEENGDLVKGFLQENPEFEMDDLAAATPEALRGHIEEKGMLQLYTNRDGADGFFISKLRRKGGSA